MSSTGARQLLGELTTAFPELMHDAQILSEIYDGLAHHDLLFDHLHKYNNDVEKAEMKYILDIVRHHTVGVDEMKSAIAASLASFGVKGAVLDDGTKLVDVEEENKKSKTPNPFAEMLNKIEGLLGL